MRKNLVLFGFMGSGKSTIGRLVAKELGLSFVDMDLMIEERHGCTIEEMFSVQGEAFFRDIESKLVRELSQEEGQLISTGGGVVLRDENIQNFAQQGVLVLLQIDAETALQRTKGSRRPLLKSSNPAETIQKLLGERKPFYDKIPHVVKTSQRPVNEIVEEVVQLYKKLG